MPPSILAATGLSLNTCTDALLATIQFGRARPDGPWQACMNMGETRGAGGPAYPFTLGTTPVRHRQPTTIVSENVAFLSQFLPRAPTRASQGAVLGTYALCVMSRCIPSFQQASQLHRCCTVLAVREHKGYDGLHGKQRIMAGPGEFIEYLWDVCQAVSGVVVMPCQVQLARMSARLPLERNGCGGRGLVHFAGASTSAHM